ncbi:MAG: transglutaminase domain-containing protein, partial [Pseudomonadota bacterium]
MKSLLVSALAAFACHAMAAPHDPAPLPDDVVTKLLHEPYRQPVDPVARQLQRRLDETEALVRRWQLDAGSAVAAYRAQQLEAQIESLGQMKAPVQQRLSERGNMAVKKIKGRKARAAALKAQGQSTEKLLGQFDRLRLALGKIETAATPQARSQALKGALDLLHQVRGRQREREEAPSAVPWPTARVGGEAGPSPRKRVDAVPKYLAERQARYLNSVASNGPILLAAAPATPAEAGQCYTGGTVDAADLAATPDAQKDDPEIAALAEKLGHSPAKILAWVHDNIAYEPYWGSLKGAKGALVAGSGNATDQASLMIALLRASNIPARYVSGEIQINDAAPAQPGGRALRWLGAKTYVAAANILAKGGIPAGTVSNASSQHAGVALDHVWVEACVPYSHYRGAAVTNAGHRWVPLDAAFKDKAYRQDIDVNVSFDYGFDSGDYLAARTDQLPHERYATDVETAALAQGKDLADLSPEGGVQALKLDILPASLPYTVTSFIQLTGAASIEPSELPSAHRYTLDVTVKSGATALLTRGVSYPDAALKRLTLSFTPADSASQTWWNGWNGSFATLPASGVNVKPVLKLEGVEVTGSAAGATALTSGNLLTTIIKLRLPDSNWGTQCVADSGTGSDTDVTCVNKTVYDNIKPGGYHALQAHAFQTSDRYLKERARQLIDAVRANPAPTPAAPAAYDATLGEFLHLALAKYLRYGVDSSKQIGEQMNIAGLRGNDIGLTTVDLKTEYLFDQPYAIKAGGLLIDVKGGQSRFTKLDTTATTAAALKDEIWPAFKLALYSGSAFEHYIWQEMARTDAVSTVRGLQ